MTFHVYVFHAVKEVRPGHSNESTQDIVGMKVFYYN